jgi:hypothetical protein
MWVWAFGGFSLALVNQIAIAAGRRPQAATELHHHELVNPQGGVALSAGANDWLAMVDGSGPCVTVEPASSML